jgi:transcriptional regulator with XRE-family HTH domain
MADAHHPNWKLRQARIEQGFTQSKLAELLGVDTKTVQRWEQGTHIPRPYAQKRLCAILQHPPQDLGFGDRPDRAERETGASSLQTKQHLCAYYRLLLLNSLLLALLLLLLILTRAR